MMYHKLGNLDLGSCTMEEELHDGWKLRRKVEENQSCKMHGKLKEN
jgi:hypothetical protein